MLGCLSLNINTTCRFSILPPWRTEARCYSGFLSTSYPCWVYLFVIEASFCIDYIDRIDVLAVLELSSSKLGLIPFFQSQDFYLIFFLV